MFRIVLLLAALTPAAPAAEEDLSAVFDQTLPAVAPTPPRSEAQQRRIASAALYAQARLDHRRHEFGKSLRRTQRAWRYRPQATELLLEIVSLANDLRRTDETVRYALLAGDTVAVDALVLKRLALQLSGQQQWRQALQLYELAVQRAPSQNDENLEIGDALLYFDMGRLSFVLQEFDKAAEYFGRVQRVLEDPQQLSENVTLQKMLVGQADRTYQLLAESYLAVGQLERAAALFRKAHQADKNDALLDYYLARIDARSSQDESALQRLERYLQAEANRAERQAFALLAELLSRTRGEQAEQELLARLDPLAAAEDASATLLQFLGDRHRTAGRWEDAAHWYARIVDDEPTADALAGMLEVQLQQRRPEALLDALGKAAAAGFLLDDLNDTGTQLTADQELLGALLAEAHRRLEADRQHLAGSGIALAAADLAISGGRYEQAEPLLELALEADEPDVRSRALLSWGVDLLRAGQFSQAADLFRRGVDQQLLSDRSDIGHFYLVRALALAGQTDEALRRAEAAASSFPDTLRLQSLPAWVLYRTKRYDQARSRYQAVLDRLDSIHDHPAIRQEMRDVRLSLSSLAVHQADLEQAEEWLEQVLDEFPEDFGALNDLGYLWADQGKHLHWSLEMIQKAVDQDPENIAYLDSLGWVYYRLGRYDQAIDWLEKAAAGDTPDGVILDHLGDAYWQAERPAQARATWQRAAEQFDKAGETSQRDASLDKIKNPQHSKK